MRDCHGAVLPGQESEFISKPEEKLALPAAIEQKGGGIVVFTIPKVLYLAWHQNAS